MNTKLNKKGFITMILVIIFVVVAIIGLVYWRVMKANQ